MYVLDVRITVTQKSILFATSLLQKDYQNWKRGIFVQLLVYEVKWKFDSFRSTSSAGHDQQFLDTTDTKKSLMQYNSCSNPYDATLR